MDKNGAVSKAAPFFLWNLGICGFFPARKKASAWGRGRSFCFYKDLQGTRQKESAPVRGKKLWQREKSRMGHGNSPYES